jgi:hypothetical protein
VAVPFAIKLVGLDVIVEVVVDAAIGTEPQIDKLGVPEQLNVDIFELALVPSPILPLTL